MENKKIKVFQKSVSENFQFLKAAKDIQGAYLRAVPIPGGGYLVPASEVHLNDHELLQSLADWRNENVEVYPTQFEANLESTKKWFKEKLLNVPDRILFLLVNNAGKVIGHVGLNSCHNNNFSFEIDNVVRGVQNMEKGIFSRALLAIIDWARKTINVNYFYLRVMDDNLNAINFYRKNSFFEYGRTALSKEIKEGITSYRESKPGEVALKNFVLMKYVPPYSAGSTMILTAGPSISARETSYVFDAVLNGWNNQWSKYLTKFESAFAEYVGAKYALATSSCTGALQIALMTLGIEPGDEVIVPDVTWVATANAVRYVGAVPVFADIELDSWNIDSDSIEALITPKTKLIIPVHMYGHPARMNAVLEVANRHGLKVVEDAAPAIGAEWQGKRCGSFGDFAAFSFQGAKLLVTGEGGMLVTSDEALFEKAKKIWDQGRNPAKQFWIDSEGVKFKMSNIQAALGLGQLERADELIEMKRRIFSWYEEGLSEVPFVTLNKEVASARSIYWMTSLLLSEDSEISRDHLMQQLKAKNIDTRPVFPPISKYPIWPLKQTPKPIALKVGMRAMNLPSGVCLTKDEVMYVCRNISEMIRH